MPRRGEGGAAPGGRRRSCAEGRTPRRGEDAATGEVRQGGGAGSAATSPRPAAAPRHKVRGERRGEVGDSAAMCPAAGDGGGGGGSAGERG
jgi:hypothetical protein